MDRNMLSLLCRLVAGVALRKESVDRNLNSIRRLLMSVVSLSARRAWIEICGGASARLLALLSLSARRAWIEIVVTVSVPLVNGGRSPQGERG